MSGPFTGHPPHLRGGVEGAAFANGIQWAKEHPEEWTHEELLVFVGATSRDPVSWKAQRIIADSEGVLYVRTPDSTNPKGYREDMV